MPAHLRAVAYAVAVFEYNCDRNCISHQANNCECNCKNGFQPDTTVSTTANTAQKSSTTASTSANGDFSSGLQHVNCKQSMLDD